MGQVKSNVMLSYLRIKWKVLDHIESFPMLNSMLAACMSR